MPPNSVPSLNRRQRSNTSPAHPLPPLNVASTTSTLISLHPVSLTKNQHLKFDKLRKGEMRLGEQEQSTTASSKSPLSSLKSLDKSSLKREANSPVYLDNNTISVASSNNNSQFFNHDHMTRRVVQCGSSRIRSYDSDVTSISSQDEGIHLNKQNSKETDRGITINKNKGKTHGQRNKWTKEETEALVRGCNNLAIGQWKAIRDSEPLLAKRSPGDLKDRFRTYFPDAYRQHYPNAKTHISSRVRSVDSKGNPLFGENAIRRERKQFSAEEDAALKRGYIKFGTAWSSIQRDPVLASRKATDLRDRFRNAFPDLYAAAGYKPRATKSSGSNMYNFLLDPHHECGSFDAIDLSMHSSHRSRANGHLSPNQYQLPSLDFLKAHGVEAFSDLRMTLPGPQAKADEDTSSGNGPPSMASNLTPHFMNMTPRPAMNTPRPNDSTPRPRKSFTTTRVENVELQTIEAKEVCSSILPAPVKSPKSLQRSQSSMNLAQFSNLYLVDSSFNPLTINYDTRATTYSANFTDSVNYGGVSALAFSGSHIIQSLGSKLNHGPTINDQLIERTQSPAVVTTLEQDMTPVADVVNASDWGQELDIASQKFPGVFDLSGFANDEIFKTPDDGSRTSSLVSSNTSMDSVSDRVVFPGDIGRLSQIHSSTNEFNPTSSGCQYSAPQQSQHQSQLLSMNLSSPQVQDFMQNSHFLEHDHNAVHEPLNDKIKINLEITYLHSFQCGHSTSTQPINSEELNQEVINHRHLPQNNLSSSLNPPP